MAKPLSFWRRFLSYFIDIYSAVLVGSLFGESLLVVGLLGMAVLHVWMTATSGRSLGRYVVGGRVVSLEPNGHEGIGFGRAALRILIGLTNSFFLANILSILLNEDRRALNDLATSTKVVLVRGAQPAPHAFTEWPAPEPR